MQVKLCARCPYSPRDLADHYDINAALHLCATYDAEYDPCETLRRPTCRTRVSNATGKTGLTARHAVPSATESLALFAITAVARPSVQPDASSVSSSAGTATAAGYGDFELPEHRGTDQSASPGAREFRTGSRHAEHTMRAPVRDLFALAFGELRCAAPGAGTGG